MYVLPLLSLGLLRLWKFHFVSDLIRDDNIVMSANYFDFWCVKEEERHSTSIREGICWSYGNDYSCCCYYQFTQLPLFVVQVLLSNFHFVFWLCHRRTVCAYTFKNHYKLALLETIIKISKRLEWHVVKNGSGFLSNRKTQLHKSLEFPPRQSVFLLIF